MELKELQKQFLVYAAHHPIYDVVDDFENDIDFDERGEPLFDVDRVIYEYKEKIIFVLRRVYIVSADSEDELDTWMRGFLEYVGISGATPLQHNILNDTGADYDVEIHCNLT